ncbi:hypothetical protein B9J78_02320 [bacterium Unc6]|nr:hypothetical protein [bacterium Unc6]
MKMLKEYGKRRKTKMKNKIVLVSLAMLLSLSLVTIGYSAPAPDAIARIRAAAMKDMTEAGITRATARAMLREAMKADPSLEEVTTITAAMVDMHEAGLTPEHSLALIKLHGELEGLGIAREIFLEEFSTLAAAKIDMHEAGITGAAAMAMIREAMKADPSLEEVATIIADKIDLVDEQPEPPVEQQEPPVEQQEPQDNVEQELPKEPEDER